MNSVNVNAPCFMLTSVFDPSLDTEELIEAASVPDASQVGDIAAYLLVVLVAKKDFFAADLSGLSDSALAEVLEEATSGWHPDLRRVLGEAHQRTPQTFVVADPISQWQTPL